MERMYSSAKKRAGAPPSPEPTAAAGPLLPLSLAPSNTSHAWVHLTASLPDLGNRHEIQVGISDEKWKTDAAAARLIAEHLPAIPNTPALEAELNKTLEHALERWQPVGTGEALVDIELNLRDADGNAYVDKFQWDLNDVVGAMNGPETFAASLCADLGLDSAAQRDIEHSLREQLAAHRLRLNAGDEPAVKRIKTQ